MQEKIPEYKATLSKMSATLSQISQDIDKITSTPYLKMEEKMSNSDFAKVNLNLAYSLNTLYYNLLKTKGKIPEDHEVMQEMKLIGTAYSKFDKVVEIKKSKPASRIDKEASSRIISASLAGNQAK